MRDALGDGYTEALRLAWKGDVPESADLVMFWWAKAAAETVQGRCKRFGFITTNSIHQTFNRRVIEPFLTAAKKPLHLAYAIPDHPWIDSADGAAVRIAMTVAAPGKSEGILEKVTSESPLEHGENEVTLSSVTGTLAANLQVGSDLTSCGALQANSMLAHRGVQTIGSGFIITPDLATTLGFGRLPGIENHVRGYRNGRDLTDKPRGLQVIDLFGLTADQVQNQWPAIYQHLLIYVKPVRDQNNRESYRKRWWIHGEPRKDLRPALAGLPRYIATVETSKHRFFTFLDQSILPDNKLIAIASDDPFILGVLSSSLHTTWALKSGSWLGVGNDSVYVKTRCFETFPFPALEEGGLKQRIRDLGERLDAHRKRQQEQHPSLTLTGMYNVLEKLRAGETLTAKDKQIHDQALVTLLKQIHDDLDAAVLQAYGWTGSVGILPTLKENHRGRDAHAPCDELLPRLVALNRARAAEEKHGQIRYLRPDYQRSGDLRSPQETQLPGTETNSSPSKIQNPESKIWPPKLPAQVTLIRQLLATHPTATPEQLSAQFGRKNKSRTDQIEGILETLRELGQV